MGLFSKKTPSSQKVELNASTYVGIGAQIVAQKNGKYEIKSIVPDGPAALAGTVKPGDIIESVDGKSITGMKLQDVVPYIRGPAGTSVGLEVTSGSVTQFIEIVRQLTGDGAKEVTVVAPTKDECAKLGSDAVERMLRLVAESDWANEGTKDGVEICTKLVEGSRVRGVRGKGVIKGDKSKMLELVTGVAHINKWDPRFEKGSCLEKLSGDQDIFYASYSSGAPMVAGRDFVYLETRKELEDGSMVLAAVSVEHPGAPKPGKKVRGEMMTSGWMISPGADGEWNVVYLVQVDPKGWLPKSLVNSVAQEEAQCVLRLRQSMQTA